MKKLSCSILILFTLVVLVGCGNSQGTNDDVVEVEQDVTTKIDHEIYKYMKISCNLTKRLYYTADDLFTINGGGATIDGENVNPCLLVEFDTTTGKAVNVTLYKFFSEYDDTWVDAAIEAFELSEYEYKSFITNVTKGRVNEATTYLSCTIDPDAYDFEPAIGQLLIRQDIEHYKNSVYFDSLGVYGENKPSYEEGDNYFYNEISYSKIEWGNTEFKPY